MPLFIIIILGLIFGAAFMWKLCSWLINNAFSILDIVLIAGGCILSLIVLITFLYHLSLLLKSITKKVREKTNEEKWEINAKKVYFK